MRRLAVVLACALAVNAALACQGVFFQQACNDAGGSACQALANSYCTDFHGGAAGQAVSGCGSCSFSCWDYGSPYPVPYHAACIPSDGGVWGSQCGGSPWWWNVYTQDCCYTHANGYYTCVPQE